MPWDFTAATAQPATEPAPAVSPQPAIPRGSWPAEAIELAKLAVPADRGIGDVYSRITAGDPLNIQKWKQAILQLSACVETPL